MAKKDKKIVVEITLEDITEDVYEVLLSNLLVWLYSAKLMAEPEYSFNFDMYESKGNKRPSIKKT